MKNLLLTLGIIFSLISCQLDTGFQDLTPDDGQASHFYFNSPAFVRVLDIVCDEVLPDTIFEIDQPEAIIDRSPWTRERYWYTTDTFAFDPADFEAVVCVLRKTVETRLVKNTSPSRIMAPIEIGGKGAWSKANEYWIVPQTNEYGRWWIQISRSGSWWSKKYTANAIWMEATKIDPDGDVS